MVAYDTIGRQVRKGKVYPGRKVVATAGVAEPLAATSFEVDWVISTAELDNTGLTVFGDSTVVASLSTRLGTPLYASDTVVLHAVDLNEVYIDSTVTGDGVTFTFRQ